MEHADGKCIIKRARKRQIIDVGLNDVRVGQVTSSRECSFDGGTQIDSDYLACAPLRGQLSMAPFAAPAFEHSLVFEKLGLDRR